MPKISINLAPDARFELAFASVIPGKEAQLFTEYFPKVGPVVADLGASQVASFAILDSAADISAPTMGALFQWPAISAYQALHKDSRYLAVKHLRDEALSHLWNGHFFAVDQVTLATFEPEKPYAVVIAPGEVEIPATALALALAADSINTDYAGRMFTIADWTPGAKALLEGNSSKIDFFKIKFNPPKISSK